MEDLPPQNHIELSRRRVTVALRLVARQTRDNKVPRPVRTTLGLGDHVVHRLGVPSQRLPTVETTSLVSLPERALDL